MLVCRWVNVLKYVLFAFSTDSNTFKYSFKSLSIWCNFILVLGTINQDIEIFI